MGCLKERGKVKTTTGPSSGSNGISDSNQEEHEMRQTDGETEKMYGQNICLNVCMHFN